MMRKIVGARAKRVKAKFLDNLAKTGVVSVAAAAAGISRDLLYTWRAREPKFAAAWEDAWEQGIDRLEAEAMRRAVEGVQEDVYHAGVKVGTRVLYSDGLLKFMIQTRRPQYRQIDVTSGGKALEPQPKILIIPAEPPEPDPDSPAPTAGGADV